MTVVASGADGQTAEKTRGDSTGAVLGQGVHARRCGGPDVQETVEFHSCQERDVAEFPGVLLPSSRHLYISRQTAAWLD